MQPCVTDYLCVCPGIQQVIGIGTILSNFVKMIYDIAIGILTQTWKGNEDLYERLEKAEGTSEEKEVTQIILDLPGYQFEWHVIYILIGIIRAIPIVGSLYSLGVLTHNITITPVLNDPRWPQNDPRHLYPIKS